MQNNHAHSDSRGYAPRTGGTKRYPSCSEMMRLPLFLFIAACTPVVVQAARMPDKVEKQFVIEGERATVIANFMGFPSNHDGVYRLPWAQNTAKCFKEMGEQGPIYTLCDPTDRVNVVKFYAGEKPKLIISGHWFDGETGTWPDVPKYSFSSPIVSSNEEISDWSIIIDKLGNRLLTEKNKRAQILEGSLPLVQISLEYVEGKPRYVLGIDDRLPAVRKLAVQKYQDCLEWHNHHPMRDGGC